jgi:hypothetical protein
MMAQKLTDPAEHWFLKHCREDVNTDFKHKRIVHEKHNYIFDFFFLFYKYQSFLQNFLRTGTVGNRFLK